MESWAYFEQHVLVCTWLPAPGRAPAIYCGNAPPFFLCGRSETGPRGGLLVRSLGWKKRGEGDIALIQQLQKIWNIVTLLLVAAAALLVAAFWGPRLFGLQPYVFTSGSMEPQYPVGSMAYVRSVAPEQVQPGQVITFLVPGTDSVATHQVRETDADARVFYTQGINNRDENGQIIPDAAPVPYENLIGTPVFCIPGLGNINRLCTTPPGIFLLPAAVVLVVLIQIILETIAPPGKKV